MYGLQRAQTTLMVLRKQLELVDGVTPESKGILRAINISLIDLIQDIDGMDDAVSKCVNSYENRIKKLQEQLKKK